MNLGPDAFVSSHYPGDNPELSEVEEELVDITTRDQLFLLIQEGGEREAVLLGRRIARGEGGG